MLLFRNPSYMVGKIDTFTFKGVIKIRQIKSAHQYFLIQNFSLVFWHLESFNCKFRKKTKRY